MDVQAYMRERWFVLRPSLLRLFEASVAAALAWWLARLIPHHHQPFFAPIAAVIAMGAPIGTRGRQAVDLLVGVLLGIGIAALIATLAGSGTWQIGVAAFTAMIAGILIDGRPLVVSEAGVSAVLLLALHQPGAAPGRLIDALIGGGVSIAMAQLLFPIDPLKVVASAARKLAGDLADASSSWRSRCATTTRVPRVACAPKPRMAPRCCKHRGRSQCRSPHRVAAGSGVRSRPTERSAGS